MDWKVILAVFLAIAIVFCVLFGDLAEMLLNPQYIVYLFDMWGQNPVPDILGGHSFEDGFVEGSKAVVSLVGYPLRFVYWIGQQFFLFMVWSTGHISPIGGDTI